MSTTIDASKLSEMFLAGAINLEANKEWINELNVFPVPDGDTGTNMTLTIQSASSAVEALGPNPEMKDLCKAMSSGSLRGARGNSGVILSQLIRGFGKIARKETELTIPVIADGFDRATETAYKAVMKPKEGTILTVAKGMSEKARELADGGCEDMEQFFAQIIEHGDQVLESTPDMLPVLKQAGVVDSGGQGLMCFVKGMNDCFLGKEITLPERPAQEPQEEGAESAAPAVDESGYTYSTAFTIILERRFNGVEERKLRKFLESMGESVEITADHDVVRVSTKTDDPGMAIQKALSYGQLTEIEVRNLRHRKAAAKPAPAPAKEEAPAPAPAPEPAKPAEPAKEVGFITVSVGAGIEEIFKGLGVDEVISGGQTMNPSTDDIMNAIEKVNAKTIFVMPNNGNIIMAANQAADLTEDKKIVVIPTKNVPQGITAVINYMPDLDPEANKENMLEEIGHVRCAEVTYAVRNTMIDDVQIREGDYMGIAEKKIAAVGRDRDEVTLETLGKIVDDSTEIISVYYGSDVTDEEAEAIRGRIAEKFSGLDVEMQAGGQPIYYYILSAE